MSSEQGGGVNHRIEIRKQVQLPLSKAYQICMQGIRTRLARSVITAAGIFLGIAFFSSVRMSGTFTTIQSGIVQVKKQQLAAGVRMSDDDIKMISSSEQDEKDAQNNKNRMTWLSIMALIVCTVGITNAMLMSVTERYKEIGTMKCLGALDSFVVKLFFIEACFLGLIASVAGFLAGWLVISLVNLVTLGFAAFGAAFWLSSLQLMGVSALLGVILTFLATIAPAVRAARMPPAAALRVEI